ncbi:GatB/YqeY domain-containing protein [Flaviaesturariibacter terrae]
MTLEQKIMEPLKEAMKSKNEAALRALRAIKAEIIKAKTEPGAGGELPADKEIPMLQKMVKQRRDALEIYQQQGRPELAQKEQEEIDVIAGFLPQQLSEEELKNELRAIIAQVGASSPADMGKVMGVASKQLGGRAEGKAISAAVKELLAQK